MSKAHPVLACAYFTEAPGMPRAFVFRRKAELGRGAGILTIAFSRLPIRRFEMKAQETFFGVRRRPSIWAAADRVRRRALRRIRLLCLSLTKKRIPMNMRPASGRFLILAGFFARAFQIRQFGYFGSNSEVRRIGCRGRRSAARAFAARSVGSFRAQNCRSARTPSDSFKTSRRQAQAQRRGGVPGSLKSIPTERFGAFVCVFQAPRSRTGRACNCRRTWTLVRTLVAV